MNADLNEARIELRKVQDKFPLLIFHPVGSQYTVNPPPEGDTDLDFICQDTDKLIGFLLERGFYPESESKYEGSSAKFQSFRKGALNILVTGCEYFLIRFLTARNLCRVLNLKEKRQRVIVHKYVLYGEIEHD